LRSDRAHLAAVVGVIAGLSSNALAQAGAPSPEEGPVPVAEDPAPESPTPPPTPTPTPTPTPSPTAGPTTDVERHVYQDRGFVIGFEAGVAAPAGTTATIYDGGFGSGFVFGYRYDRLTFEGHVHQRYALTAKDEQLRGVTTLGTLSAASALVRVRVLDIPLVEVMAGPARLTTPILVIGEDGVGDQRVEGMELHGLGLIAGAALGIRLSTRLALTLELRTVVASRWELPGDTWVVPGDPAPDGGRMFTTSREDATGSATTATVLIRVLL
jgi:hypothetical protein